MFLRFVLATDFFQQLFDIVFAALAVAVDADGQNCHDPETQNENHHHRHREAVHCIDRSEGHGRQVSEATIRRIGIMFEYSKPFFLKKFCDSALILSVSRVMRLKSFCRANSITWSSSIVP